MSVRSRHSRAACAVFLSLLAAAGCGTPAAHYADSPQQQDGRFRNPEPVARPGFWRTAGILTESLTSKGADTRPRRPIPMLRLTQAELLSAPDASIYRLGHATVLLKLHGEFWLTDPMFSRHASPSQWAGPTRFAPPPIAIDELPPIRAVIISHDHYDHLDRDSILRLAPKTGVFLTPLGVGERLIGWGVDPAKVRQLDWWQETRVGGVRLAATPARHFSGRTPFDTNRTLWASWVIDAGAVRIFFSGDTGYHAGFASIGQRYGPFDLTMLETGAYDARWPEVHMQPEQTLRAHQDLRGRVLLPIHNATFDLAFHAWNAPLERIGALADAQGVPVALPMLGERLPLMPEAAPQTRQPWWREAAAIRQP